MAGLVLARARRAALRIREFTLDAATRGRRRGAPLRTGAARQRVANRSRGAPSAARRLAPVALARAPRPRRPRARRGSKRCCRTDAVQAALACRGAVRPATGPSRRRRRVPATPVAPSPAPAVPQDALLLRRCRPGHRPSSCDPRRPEVVVVVDLSRRKAALVVVTAAALIGSALIAALVCARRGRRGAARGGGRRSGGRWRVRAVRAVHRPAGRLHDPGRQRVLGAGADLGRDPVHGRRRARGPRARPGRARRRVSCCCRSRSPRSAPATDARSRSRRWLPSGSLAALDGVAAGRAGADRPDAGLQHPEPVRRAAGPGRPRRRACSSSSSRRSSGSRRR